MRANPQPPQGNEVKGAASVGPNTPILSIRALSKTYPIRRGWFRSHTHWALRDVSFDVMPGEIVAVVGESGSGKSTLGRLLLRLEKATAGEARLADSPSGRSFRERIQLVFQDPFASLNPAHSVHHHLARPLLLHGKAGSEELDATIHALLDSVGLCPAQRFAARYPHELSGGQRQRVAI
ncbi:MAG: ATP-binding cassette domain-containing protein, partial [Polyangiaceae bacterium]|nr:ATP-binding cassette domain-containing protein [Polyangiaceae bacterium]